MTKSVPTGKTAQADPGMPGRKGRRLLWLGGGTVALLLATVVVLNLSYSRSLRVSKETTYITEPLKSCGKQVDYFLALQQATYPANIATDENGYRLIVQHLGRSPGHTPEHFASVSEQLGLHARAIRPDMTYQAPYDFLASYVSSSQFDESLLDRFSRNARSRSDVTGLLNKRLDRPWTLDDLPMMAPWLEQNGPALDLVAQAVRKPTFHMPLVRGSEDELLYDVLSDLDRMCSLARSLCARANHRLALGDIDDAIRDVITCKRLGRHVGHGGLYWGAGHVFEWQANAVGIAGSLEHPPSRKQLERFVAELENLPPEVEVQSALLTERFRELDLIQALAHGHASWDDVGLSHNEALPWLAALGFEWNIVTRQLNAFFDDPVGLGQEPYSVPFTVPVVMSGRARSDYLAELLCNWVFRSWRYKLERPDRHACAKHVKRITLAMLLYEREHGTLPPAWSVDADGNVLHSWRVLLLPYLGYEALYESIRLDQPWDSEHNRQFHEEELPIYRCAGHESATPGHTSYSVVVGPDMPFEAGQGKKPADFGPLSDDMILLVERAEPVPWMDPAQELSQAAVEQVVEWHRSAATDMGGMGMGGPVRGMGGVRSTPRPAPSGIGRSHGALAHFGLRSGAVVMLDEEREADRLGPMLRGTNVNKMRDD